jgi:glycosyltransferase involved in cell wall biosynthesis
MQVGGAPPSPASILEGTVRAGGRGQGLKILFIHQNFPAQYFHIARHYAADPANTVVAVGETANLRQRQALPGVTYLGYDPPPATKKNNPHTHHYVRRHEADIRRGQAAARLLAQMREQGFNPDVVCVHPDWGEALFIRLIWPDAPILTYAEHYGSLHDPALDFDPEFPASADTRCLAHAANATRAISYADATHLQTPTRFQWNALPPAFRERASLLYDGINTQAFCPDPDARLILPPDAANFSRENERLPAWFPLRREALTLTRAQADEPVVSFINRTLEPSRGWHSYARALPLIQAACPQARFVIVGRTTGGYGAPPPSGKAAKNWRDIYLNEIRARIDPSRLHFTGPTSPQTIRSLLQVTRAHVYLSYPFFLSYSPVEAMSCAAPLVLADTEPAREIAAHEKTALLVDFHSSEAIADAVLRLIREPELAARLGQAARDRALRRYDMESVCLPQWRRLIETLARGEQPAAVLTC